jgi:hypothetical protein
MPDELSLAFEAENIEKGRLGAPGRAHFVDAEAEKQFHELMDCLTGEPDDEDYEDVGL